MARAVMGPGISGSGLLGPLRQWFMLCSIVSSCAKGASMRSGSLKKSALVKGIILIIFVVGALITVSLLGAKEFLTAENLETAITAAGWWAPLVFILIYALGVCLFIPATLLTAVGAAIFGVYWGFIYSWVGAMIGAAGGFFIGRYLGREFTKSTIGDRLKKYDDAIARNGFATVLYLRLVYFPFTPMNYGIGLTKVRFRDYLWGTGLGILVGTFIFAFFVGSLVKVWVSGQWDQLLTWKILLSLGLLIFSFFIPMIIKKLKILED
jgi:uncharacterized membrane protein YdjX (TVP38/TMEM64 family)